MKKEEMNLDIYATMTVQDMLLQQLIASLFAGQRDGGELFEKQFMDGLRFNLSVSPDTNQDAVTHAQYFQEIALQRAQRFFEQVKARSPRN